MKDLRWFVNRLRAMEPREIPWRITQKIIQKKEKRYYYLLNKPVFAIPLYNKNISRLHIDIDKLSINWDNDDWKEFSSLDLFGIYDYQEYKKKWNAGFQTSSIWDEKKYSPTIEISSRVDIGDIRTNWELNRHFQFAAIAKSYYCTGKLEYLNEFINLFYDWNQHNLFLHGVEWTSAMELAIRVNSWVYSYSFLKKAKCDKKLLDDIEHGIIVMTDFIFNHHARYSSANNHLIIEMYAVALVGIITGYDFWRNSAIKILTEELSRQNYEDGVNKEMSLHYQSFVMEAYGLLWVIMYKNHIEIPLIWKKYISAMTEFIADSTDDFGSTMEFGDNDEGKILDLIGKIENHYQYVLNMMGCLLEKKFTNSNWHENLKWIIPKELWFVKERYIPKLICCRKIGGYTFIRSSDRKILIGIDHANLGFGRIAAHGHADALSFQLFISGSPVLVDSGTYNYHYTPKDRDFYRSTVAHNTVRIDGHEQSEMLGPFIWGKKAKAEIKSISKKEIILKCWYNKIIHIRKFRFDEDTITIYDDILNKKGKVFFHIAPQYKVYHKLDNRIIVGNNLLEIKIGSKKCKIDDYNYSKIYGSKTYGNCVSAEFKGDLTTIITMFRDEGI